MDHNAFTGGVDPGGLWTQNDIRILICYILDSVRAPLTAEDLCRVLQGRALANYFESGDALAALEAQGHILSGPEGCTVTNTGRQIARDLDTGLPIAVRDKALEAAVELLAQARSRRENRVEIKDLPNGCRVSCSIAGGLAGISGAGNTGSTDLMTLSLYVPDRPQAKLIEERFYRDPEGVYRLLLAALTGDKEFAKDYLSD